MMKIVSNLFILIALHFLNTSIRTYDNVQLSSFKSDDTLVIYEYEYQKIFMPKEVLDANIFEYDVSVYDSLLSFIKKHEGYSDSAYIGLAGEPLIAYGHLISKEEYIYDTTNHVKITQKQADSILYEDIRLSIGYTYKFTGLTGNKLLALSSLVYNAGIGSVFKSGLINYINSGKKRADITGVWLSCKYHKKTGKNGRILIDKKGNFIYTKNDKLYERRLWEVKLFFS